MFADELFEAFVDPAQIGSFWFSSSSERWEAGRTIKLRYEEYNAPGAWYYDITGGAGA